MGGGEATWPSKQPKLLIWISIFVLRDVTAGGAVGNACLFLLNSIFAASLINVSIRFPTRRSLLLMVLASLFWEGCEQFLFVLGGFFPGTFILYDFDSLDSLHDSIFRHHISHRVGGLFGSA